MNYKFSLHLLLLLGPFIVSAQPKKIEYPIARKDTVHDNYFGTLVADPYRWLENDSLTETKNWLTDQAALTRKFINKVDLKYDLKEDLQDISWVNFGTSTKSGSSSMIS